MRGSDKIADLKFGEVVEIGSHTELINNDGLYAHLCMMNYSALEGAAAPTVMPNGNGKVHTNGKSPIPIGTAAE